jgi:hypothetical protein
MHGVAVVFIIIDYETHAARHTAVTINLSRDAHILDNLAQLMSSTELCRIQRQRIYCPGLAAVRPKNSRNCAHYRQKTSLRTGKLTR